MQEQLALNAFGQKQMTNYMGHLLIIKAILKAANIIAAATTGGDSPDNKDLKDLLQSYKELLMPETIEDREKSAAKVKEIMEREMSQGEMKVEAMVYDKRRKKGLN